MDRHSDILRNTCFFAAEYNPFHLGHQKHLMESRRLSGAKYLVAVMSGSFVQRGEPAILDKWQRAQIALSLGADAVLELPFAYALQSAENFAYAPAALAHAMEAGYFSFGCETTLEACRKAAANYQTWNEEVSQALKEGQSFPKALSGLNEEIPANAPNTILGGMYLLWLERLSADITPVIVSRDMNLNSASEIRNALARGEPSKALMLPEESQKALSEGSQADKALLDVLMLNALRNRPLCDEALAVRVQKAAWQSITYQETLQAAKSKNFTMARVKRACVRTLCGLDSEDLQLINREKPIYARVLGFKKGSSELISAMAARSQVPVILNAAEDEPRKQSSLSLLWKYDTASTDMRMLMDTRTFMRTAGQDYTRRLLVL